MAGQLGYCGLDRTRQPLNGDEIRGCWEAWPAGALRPDTAPTIGPARPLTDEHGHVEFIEVHATAGVVPVDQAPALPAPLAPDEPGWSLWGEPDR